MRAKFYILIFIFLLILNIQNTHSQGKKRKSIFKHEKANILVSLGTSTYYGDLCDKFECMVFRPNMGIGFMYRLTNHIYNKTELNYYRLYATDVYPERNLSFRSGNFEFYTSAVFDLFPYTKHFPKRKLINPYVFLGLGLTYFNPRGLHPNKLEWMALRPLETEGESYFPITLIIPYGFGVKIKFHRNYDFMLEGGYRKTFTDRLDDVSNLAYKDLGSFTDEDAAAMSMKAVDETGNPTSYKNSYLKQQRGNPNKLDGYFLMSVKFRYIIGGAKGSFKGKHPLLQPHHK